MENNFLILIDDISMEPVNTNEQVCAGWKNNLDSIYSQHERHEYLDREIRLYRNNPPPVYRWAATTIPVIDTLIIPDILFATGSAALNRQIYPLLDSFCAAIGKKKIDSLVVSGHTDSIGSARYNTKLSAGRAAEVVAYIKQKSSMDTGHIKIKFFGYLKPVASNATAEGRQKNRRVELLLYRHD
jgi:outer membrane protein OmpA-like peptidoglycan-associated protein